MAGTLLGSPAKIRWPQTYAHSSAVGGVLKSTVTELANVVAEAADAAVLWQERDGPGYMGTPMRVTRWRCVVMAVVLVSRAA